MDYLLLNLSKEHEELPIAEVRAVFEGYGKAFDVVLKEKNFLVLKRSLDAVTLAKRLALTREVFEVSELGSLSDLSKVEFSGSFCVRAFGFKENAMVEREAGEIIAQSSGAKVDLSNPDADFFLFLVSNRTFLSNKKYKTNKSGFRERDPRVRPYFHPTALKPKLARLFINLARVREGDTILDPFCGSGSILIEAALMGVAPVGCDLDDRMLEGCSRNLEKFGVKADLCVGDATRLDELSNIHDFRGREGVDAIVTDPPYERSAKVFGDSLMALYDGFLSTSLKVLRAGGFIVFACPRDIEPALLKIIKNKKNRYTEKIELIGRYRIYVHKSLTRVLFVLRAI